MPPIKHDAAIAPVSPVNPVRPSQPDGRRPAPCCIPGQIQNHALCYSQCAHPGTCEAAPAARLNAALMQKGSAGEGTPPPALFGLLYAISNAVLERAQRDCPARQSGG